MKDTDLQQQNAFYTALSRRGFLKGAAALAATYSTMASTSAVGDGFPPSRILAYVGTYTPNGQGIHLFEMNPQTGELSFLKVAAKVTNPSALAFDPTGHYLYAVNEVSNFDGTNGSVTAFSVNRSTGDLTLLNVVSSEGGGPAHISVDPTGKFVFVANYGGGSIAVLPVLSGGALGSAVDVHQDVGSVGPTTATNAPPGSFAISGHDAPHAHMIEAAPGNSFVLSTDLGQDRIYVYSFNKKTGILTPASTPFASVPPGDGARHFAFHPNGRWMYSIQEEASTLIFFTFDPATGLLTEQQMVSALPKGFVGTSFASEVEVSADGRFLYALNRLHDTIAVFSIDDDSGELTHRGETSTLGDYPRNFAIDPTGNFLYTCNQRSDALTSFHIHHETGLLKFTGQYTAVGSPSIIVFLP